MSCQFLSNENTRLEWLVLIVSLILFVMACTVFSTGATILLVAFSLAVVASIFGIVTNKWSYIKIHRIVTVVISSLAAILFTVQMIFLVIAFPRILPYIYDRQLAPEPFVLGAIFSAFIVLFGLMTTVLLAIKHCKSGQATFTQPSRFVTLPIDMTPIRYT